MVIHRELSSERGRSPEDGEAERSSGAERARDRDNDRTRDEHGEGCEAEDEDKSSKGVDCTRSWLLPTTSAGTRSSLLSVRRLVSGTLARMRRSVMVSLSRFPTLARLLRGTSNALAPTNRGLLRHRVGRFAAAVVLLSVLHLLIISSYSNENPSDQPHTGPRLPGNFLDERHAHQRRAESGVPGIDAGGKPGSGTTTDPSATGSHSTWSSLFLDQGDPTSRASLLTALRNLLGRGLAWPLPGLLRRLIEDRPTDKDSGAGWDRERAYRGYAYVVPVRQVLVDWEERRGREEEILALAHLQCLNEGPGKSADEKGGSHSTDSQGVTIQRAPGRSVTIQRAPGRGVTVQRAPGRRVLEASSAWNARERRGAFADRDSRMHDGRKPIGNSNNSDRNSNSDSDSSSESDSNRESNRDSNNGIIGQKDSNSGHKGAGDRGKGSDSVTGRATHKGSGSGDPGPKQTLEERCALEGMERRQQMRKDRDSRILTQSVGVRIECRTRQDLQSGPQPWHQQTSTRLQGSIQQASRQLVPTRHTGDEKSSIQNQGYQQEDGPWSPVECMVHQGVASPDPFRSPTRLRGGPLTNAAPHLNANSRSNSNSHARAGVRAGAEAGAGAGARAGAGTGGGSPPLLLLITPTYPRPMQAPYIHQLAAVLRLVAPPFLWIVVESETKVRASLKAKTCTADSRDLL